MRPKPQSMPPSARATPETWRPSLLFERGRPGHELEAEAVVDHGEAAGGEREALAVGTGDIFAAAGAVEGLAGLGGELFAQRLQLPAAQRSRSGCGEYDALACRSAKPCSTRWSARAVHRVAHLGAEAALRQRDRLAGDVLAVEPGRAGRR